MKCFKDYIGIKSCGDDAPESGLFINQLPGINLENIDKIADRDQVTFVGVWKDVQARAIRRFKKDYQRAFAGKYVGYCCTDEECDPETIACDNKDLFVDAWMFVLGVELMIERLYSTRLNRYTTIDKDVAAELKDYYQVEYEKAMQDGIANLPKEIIEKCFNCYGKIARVETLP